MAERTPDSHPGDRVGDRQHHLKVWFVQARGYRDIWLLIITGLVVWALAGIQDSRKDAVYIQCVQQNERHDNTERVLDTQLARRAGATMGDVQAVGKGDLSAEAVFRKYVVPMPRSAEKLDLVQDFESREFVVFLIDALVPTYDCDARVKELIG